MVKDPQWEARVNQEPVLVGSGRIFTGEGDVAAASGRRIGVFAPENNIYRQQAVIESPAAVLSLAVGLGNRTPDQVVAGTPDRILTWSAQDGNIVPFWSAPPEAEARFVHLALGDVNGDGRADIVAAAAGTGAFYVYEQPAEPSAGMTLQLLTIRLVGGTPHKVAVVERAGALPLIAVAYQEEGRWGIGTFYYTERGFEAGPELTGLPAGLTAMTAGRFTGAPGQDLAWGGDDGRVRILTVNETISAVLTTERLGGTITALTAGNWAGQEVMGTGTPEGQVFFFRTPVISPSPDRVLSSGAVNDLTLTPGGRLAVGTRDGRVQVFWMPLASSGFPHLVQPGDTLWALAQRYHTTVAAIAGINGLVQPDRIYPGDILIIPRA
ncbi:MAG: LysM peptidoglycan-binding domain-containing protein [Thermoanaerobacteraceae bacterium]|nr:LysM peptidoglycan-binding domain-containing protein [Thermoanaerobacteraceae bacterium]